MALLVTQKTKNHKKRKVIMYRKTRTSTATFVLALITLTSIIPAQAIAAEDELLAITPHDAMFCLRINNLDNTLNSLDGYLQGLSPSPMSPTMMIKMQLGMLLGDPTLSTVDMTGSIAAFGLPRQDMPMPAIVVALPVKDYTQLIAQSAVFAEPDQDGISIVTSQMIPANLIAIAGPDNKYALVTTAEQRDALFYIKNDLAGKTLAKALDASETKKATSSSIWAWGNIPAINQQYDKAIFEGLDAAKEITKTMPQNQPGNPEVFFDMYIEMLKTMLKETRYISLSITPTPELCKFDISYASLPGTDTAKMLVKNPDTTPNKLLGYLQDGTAMNFAGKINAPFWKAYNNKMIDLFLSLDPTLAEDAEKSKTLVARMFDAMGSNMAGSMSINADDKPPFAYTYIFDLNDPKEYNRIFDESILFWNRISESFLEKMGMKMAFSVNRNMETYKGVSIDSAFMSIMFTDPNMPAEVTKMMDDIYGDGFTYKFATIDKLFVCAVGSGADSKIRTLIDQVKSGDPTALQSETAAALECFDNAASAEMFGTYNYIRLFDMMKSYMPAANPDGPPMPSFDVDVPTSSNLAFVTKIEDAKATLSIALPKQHLMEMKAAFDQMKPQITCPPPQPCPHTQQPADTHQHSQEIHPKPAEPALSNEL
jgi:hypothetical protein